MILRISSILIRTSCLNRRWFISKTAVFKATLRSRMVKKLEWIEMAQLAVSSILFKSFSLKLP